MTVPNRLLASLQCLECKHSPLEYDRENAVLSCSQCSAHYPAQDGIPSLLKAGPVKQNWNVWDLDKVQMLGDSYYKRAKGELPEKESSKSYARFLKRHGLYSPEDTLLDLGCATGHFLRSFRRLLDPNVLYTGIDTHFPYLQWGKEVYRIDRYCNFVHGDVLEMPFLDNSFDIIIVNLFHFFPRIDDPLREAMRVGRKTVVWRTPIGQVNYVVKIIYNNTFDEIKVITPEREDFDYSLYMLYSLEYIKGLVTYLGGKVILMERDTDFEDFDNTVLEEFKHVPATKTVHGMQINGSLALDWHYIVIDCSEYKV